MQYRAFVKKRMKRIWEKFGCMAIMAIVLCALVACGDKKDNNSNSDKENQVQTESTTEVVTDETTTEGKQETVVLTVLTDQKHVIDTKLQEYKKVFESENENVEVQFELVDNYEKEVARRLKTGDYGDVLLIPESVSNEELVNYFEPLGTVDELSEFYNKKYIQSKMVEEQIYGLPRYVNVKGIAYNEAVLAKARVVELPKTPEAFVAMLRQVSNTQPSVVGCYIGYQDGDWMAQWQSHVWGSVSGDPDYANNKLVNVWNPFDAEQPNYVVHRLLYDIVQNKMCESFSENANYEDVFGMLNRGEIACMVLGSEHVRELQSADVNPDDISFMPFPYNLEDEQYATAELDYCYAVNKNSENIELAKAWIEYILQDSGFAKSEGAITIKKKTSYPEVLKNFKGVELIISNPVEPDNVGKYEEINRLSAIYLDEVSEKERLVRSAIGETEETFEEIMADWNERWRAAIGGIRYAGDDSTEETE